MNNILYIGRSGLDAFQKKIDTISNNIANIGTIGYKRLDQSFQELLRNEIGNTGTPLSEELESQHPSLGSGAKAGAAYRVFEQGVLMPSSNPLEVAIEGNGFFGMEDKNGELIFSRVGNFSINEDGELVDSSGYEVSTRRLRNLTQYDKNSIMINPDGEITAIHEDGDMDDVGEIILYDVPNKDELLDVGKGYYKGVDGANIINTNSRRQVTSFGEIKQGFSEMSNVEVSQELVDLITAQRAYQFNSKTVQAADAMWQMTNNLKR